MTVDPGYNYVEKFAGGNNWYMMNIIDFISSVCFILKNENNELLSLNCQSVNFFIYQRSVIPSNDKDVN